jgi:IPT/TIG domain
VANGVVNGAITHVEPSAGPANLGWTADVTGVGFTPATTWTLPGLPTISGPPVATYVSPTLFRVRVGYFPPNTTASGTLYCANPAGWAAMRWAAPPHLNSVTPNNGPPAGGTEVRLIGSFEGPSKVTVAGVEVPWRLEGITVIYFTTPPGIPGRVRVEVTTWGGTVSTEFTYNLPAVGLPGTYPVPEGRGLWRLTLHDRAFAPNLHPTRNLFVAEVMDARSVRLEQALNAAAKLTFTLDGASNSAQLIRELEHDVIAWRWDDQTGRDVAIFRGVVAQSQDEMSESIEDTVNFTCHDYISMLSRRLLTRDTNFSQADQDTIVTNAVESGAKVVVTSAGANGSGVGVSLYPGSYLPLAILLVDPSGAQRPPSGVLRDRQYAAQQDVFELVDNLAHVIGGFDYDAVPGIQYHDGWPEDQLRIWYPSQGVLRDDLIYEYGSTVSGLSRSVNSQDYANYIRVVGGSSDPNNSDAPPLFAESWNTDANNVTVAKQGLWMTGDNASDVTLIATLRQRAAGELGTASLFLPAYSLTLTPGVYSMGNPHIGDVVRLIVRAGRLNVDTEIRVVGLTFEMGDSGQEDVTMQVGRADVSFGDLFTTTARQIDALARR